MSDNPEISVLLPVYNGAKTIERTINSILNQKFPSLELVVINDGSTDETFEVVKSIDDNRLRYFDKPHSGLAKTLNFGLEKCQGKYIARIDADDYSPPLRLEKQYDHLENNPGIGVVSGKVIYSSDNPQEGYKLHVDWLNSISGAEAIFNNRFQDAPVAHPSVMFRKHLVDDLGGYSEEEVPEDYELWLRWMDHGIHFDKVNDVVLHWEDSTVRLSRNHINYSDAAFHQVKAKYFQNWYLRNGGNRELWIWGRGKWVNKRVKFLESLGLQIKGYIDVIANEEHHVIHYDNIVSLEGPMILSYVANREGKAQIQEFVTRNGFKCGKDFIQFV